jgi:RNA polymerase sigma-70 factor (ECF subfamily)
MADDSSSLRTSPTLLERVRLAPANQQAWDEFVERYGRKIYAWCRQWGLQESDAEDVTQDVLLRLAAKMRHFAYDPSRSFRGWLRTLTHNAWYDFVQARHKRPGRGSGDSDVADALEKVEAGDDLARWLEEEFRRELFEEASARVRQRVQPHTWEAFRLTALEGKSGAEAAALLGMQVATVFVARSKVQKMLQDEVNKLDGSEAPAGEDLP